MSVRSTSSGNTVTFAVLADTHVPDRLPDIPDHVLELLSGLGADAILHAGDICRRRVLSRLARIAPVHAVRGNRDVLWPGNWTLPRERKLERAGCRIVLTHGERGLREYIDRAASLGSRRDTPETTERRLVGKIRDADVIVYGHTHVPRVTRLERTLLMNPGSIAPDYYTGLGATIGVLRIGPRGAVGEIVRVDAPADRVPTS